MGYSLNGFAGKISSITVCRQHVWHSCQRSCCVTRRYRPVLFPFTSCAGVFIWSFNLRKSLVNC